MPFDGTNITPKQLRAMLIHELRNLEDWRWDYRMCDACAIGIVHERFGIPLLDKHGCPLNNIYPILGKTLDISEKDARHIFRSLSRTSNHEYRYVTPEIVADALEALP